MPKYVEGHFTLPPGITQTLALRTSNRLKRYLSSFVATYRQSSQTAADSTLPLKFWARHFLESVPPVMPNPFLTRWFYLSLKILLEVYDGGSNSDLTS